MSKLILLAIAAIALIGATTMLMMNKPTLTAYPQDVIQKFKNFCAKYHKYQAGTDPDVVVFRLGVYYNNLQKIQAHNAKTSTYTMGENQFMDLTHEEFTKYYLGLKLPKGFRSPAPEAVPAKANAAIDWRKEGRVSPVKDQGQCGSCWAFSTTGGLEGLEYASQGLSLSEQQLVDCSGSYGNQGCNGGLMDQAFQYVIANGITTEDQYPYTAVDGTCQTVTSAFKISSFTDVQSGSTSDLLSKLKVQPVSIAVDAETWQFYSGGVFSDCSTSLDHGVLLVGVNSDSTWIVKNSWGSSWGDSGYITLASGDTCGLADAASVPVA